MTEVPRRLDSPPVPEVSTDPDEGPAPVRDQGEFTRVFAAQHDFVWRTLGYLGVGRPAQDDATQDVFIVVHRRWGSYDPAVPLRAWLFGIARRVADKYRARAARAAPLRVLPDPDAPLPDEALARREAAGLIEAFLAALPEEQRDVFLLAELEGLSAPEIAVALDGKLNTIYSRLRLARRAFERTLARHRARWQREGDHGEA